MISTITSTELLAVSGGDLTIDPWCEASPWLPGCECSPPPEPVVRLGPSWLPQL